MSKTDVSAARAVAEMLKSPDDLVKVSQTKVKLQREKASVEAKLKEGAKEQLDATRDALAKLKETRVSVELIKEDMMAVEKACEDPRIWVEGFGKIASVSRIHRNFVTTANMVSQLRQTSDRIAALERLLAQERQDPLGPAKNLLAIHYGISELETFRNETLLQAKRDGNPATLRSLEDRFARLGNLLESFEAHYTHLAGSLLDLVRKGNGGVAVVVAKIAEVEGQRDEKAIAIRLVKRQNKDIASRFKSVAADARTIKHYRAKVMDAIRDSARTLIERQFERATSGGAGGAAAFFEGERFDWFYGDLVLVEEELEKRFPKDWKIYTAYVKAYHRALYEFLKQYVKADPEAGVLLALASFVKTYRTNMTVELAIPPELLDPALLDGKEKDLIEDYLQLIKSKMDQWTANLMKGETAAFIKREEPPEEDADEMYGMQGSGIMFQMVNAQVDFAIDSGQGAVLARVVDEAARVMQETQTTWLKLVNDEFKRHVARPDEVPAGLVEYTMALANDLVKSADFVESLLSRLEPLVSDKYRQPISERLTAALHGYLDVAKRAVGVMIEAVFNDLLPATKTLLTTAWYGDESGMVQIVETLRDYLTDYQAHLNANLFDLLLEDLLDAFVLVYLRAVRKASKIRMPGAVARIKADVAKATEFFSSYKPDPGDLEPYMGVLEAVAGLVGASRTMFFLDWHPFAKQYGAQLAFVEAVLKARDDLDRSAVGDMMEACKKRAGDVPEPQGGTVFDRLGK